MRGGRSRLTHPDQDGSAGASPPERGGSLSQLRKPLQASSLVGSTESASVARASRPSKSGARRSTARCLRPISSRDAGAVSQARKVATPVGVGVGPSNARRDAGPKTSRSCT